MSPFRPVSQSNCESTVEPSPKLLLEPTSVYPKGVPPKNYSDTEHPNVLRLSTIPTIVDRIVHFLLCILPSVLSSRILSSHPEWALPRRFVFKKQKEYWENEFELEKAAYEMLKPLQGRFIPVCFGQIDYDDTRALLLSDIGGACLATPEGAVLRHDEVQPLLEGTLTALVNAGVSHDDLKLDNFHLLEDDHGGDRIMAVDLERVDIGLSEEQAAFVVKCAVDFFDASVQGPS